MTEIEQKDAVAQKLRRVRPGEAIEFSEEEAQALRQMARWWISWRGTMAVGGIVAHFFKWVAIISTGIIALRLGLIEWLKSGGL